VMNYGVFLFFLLRLSKIHSNYFQTLYMPAELIIFVQIIFNYFICANYIKHFFIQQPNYILRKCNYPKKAIFYSIY
jgi:hypothetical protein